MCLPLPHAGYMAAIWLYGYIAIHSAHEPLEIDFVTFSFPQRKRWQLAFSTLSAVVLCFFFCSKNTRNVITPFKRPKTETEAEAEAGEKSPSSSSQSLVLMTIFRRPKRAKDG